MNAKTLLSGTAAGTVALFLLGYVIYEPLLGSVYAANVNQSLARAEMDWLTTILATVVYAFMLTYVFTRWAGIKTVAGGAAAAATLGLLITLSLDLSMYSMMDVMQPVMLVVDPLAGAVWTACGGAAIGLALSRVG